MTSERARTLATKLKHDLDELVGKDVWSEESLEVWLRSDLRCVYCERDMLNQRNTAYHFANLDHVLPWRKYDIPARDRSNLVLSCWACNALKRTFGPKQIRRTNLHRFRWLSGNRRTAGTIH
jgi:5-methylcytosine-specific restriction endonuclease McrA